MTSRMAATWAAWPGGVLDALINPDRFIEMKSQGGIHYHQLHQLAGLASNGLVLEGTLKDIFQGMVLKGTSEVMEVTFGQGFGRNNMERYMPLWFELGISGPGALVSPVRMGREGGVRELVSVMNFHKEHGTTGRWNRKAGGKTTQVQTQALKWLYRAHCEGGKVLAGNAEADKWTSKERRLVTLPAHW
jgi:hypothetical protein